MNKKYCVYQHIFPNGKKYIGITCDVEKRWRSGKGYETQGKIANAINHYGWDNIKHEIIVDGLTKEQAEKLEMFLISNLDTIDNGYNTSIGGENINSTYLTEHVLYEIRESKELDKIYRQEQTKNSIVTLCENAKYNEEKAEIFNVIDEMVERDFEDYKYQSSNIFYDGRLERCEAYWYYVRKILECICANKQYDSTKIMRYQSYRSNYYFGRLAAERR